MGASKLLKRSRNSFELYLLSKGKGTIEVEIPEIPEIKQNFQDTTDEWVKVNLPEDINASSCIYYGKKGNLFPPHKHNDSTEQLSILNPGGKMTVLTNTDKIVLKYPDSIFFEKGKPHAVIFEEDTTFSIIWHPAFKKGWDAEVNSKSKITK